MGSEVFLSGVCGRPTEDFYLKVSSRGRGPQTPAVSNLALLDEEVKKGTE
jgi:hypothetical protein